jgi:hypothetical protein
MPGTEISVSEPKGAGKPLCQDAETPKTPAPLRKGRTDITIRWESGWDHANSAFTDDVFVDIKDHDEPDGPVTDLSKPEAPKVIDLTTSDVQAIDLSEHESRQVVDLDGGDVDALTHEALGHPGVMVLDHPPRSVLRRIVNRLRGRS